MRDIFIWTVGVNHSNYHRLRNLKPGDIFPDLPNTVVIEWIDEEEVKLEHIEK
jgi:hypothetical protein